MNLGKGPSSRFNILAVGESGLGKTTFLETLLKKYHTSNCFPLNVASYESNIINKIYIFDSETNSGNVSVHLFECCKFGDEINNLNSMESIKNYMTDKHFEWINLDAQIMTEEERLNLDERIHCVLYFIPPHRFNNINKSMLLTLSELAPIIPVVAKADSMTSIERNNYLKYISEEMENLKKLTPFGITYDFGDEYLSDCKYFMPEQRFQIEEHIDSKSLILDNSLFEEYIGDNRDPVIETASLICENFVDSSASFLDSSYFPGESVLRIGETISQSFNPQQNGMESEIETHSIGYSNMNEKKHSDVLGHNDSIFDENNQIKRFKNIFAVFSDVSGSRVYDWGVCRVDDKNFNDFPILQKLLFEDGNHFKGVKELCHKMTLRMVITKQNSGCSRLRTLNILLITLILVTLITFVRYRKTDMNHIEKSKSFGPNLGCKFSWNDFVQKKLEPYDRYLAHPLVN